MRAFGIILMLLGVTALVVGVVTGFSVYSSVEGLYSKIKEGRDIVTGKFDDVKNVFNDIDIIYERSDVLIKDYERGAITDIKDERIKGLLNDVQDVTARSIKLKESIEDEMGQLEEMKTGITSQYDSALVLSLVSFISLVASGWLFGFGALLRKSGSGA